MNCSGFYIKREASSVGIPAYRCFFYTNFRKKNLAGREDKDASDPCRSMNPFV